MQLTRFSGSDLSQFINGNDDISHSNICDRCPNLLEILEENRNLTIKFAQLAIQHQRLQFNYRNIQQNLIESGIEIKEICDEQITLEDECDALNLEISILRRKLEDIQDSQRTKGLNDEIKKVQYEMQILEERYANLERSQAIYECKKRISELTLVEEAGDPEDYSKSCIEKNHKTKEFQINELPFHTSKGSKRNVNLDLHIEEENSSELNGKSIILKDIEISSTILEESLNLEINKELENFPIQNGCILESVKYLASHLGGCLQNLRELTTKAIPISEAFTKLEEKICEQENHSTSSENKSDLLLSHNFFSKLKNLELIIKSLQLKIAELAKCNDELIEEGGRFFTFFNMEFNNSEEDFHQQIDALNDLSFLKDFEIRKKPLEREKRNTAQRFHCESKSIDSHSEWPKVENNSMETLKPSSSLLQLHRSKATLNLLGHDKFFDVQRKRRNQRLITHDENRRQSAKFLPESISDKMQGS